MSVTCTGYELIVFPDQTRAWRPKKNEVLIEHPRVFLNWENSNDIVDILLLSDALGSMGVKAELCLCYFPMAQQDRRAVVGESHGVAVMAEVLKLCDFKKVTIFDPHSDVVEACLTTAKVPFDIIKQSLLFTKLFQQSLVKPGDRITLIAPDGGAIKKTAECVKELSIKYTDCVVDMLVGMKKRNPVNGELKVYPLTDPDRMLEQSDYAVVVDDICAGGGTFTPIARDVQLLKKNNTSLKLGLYVTHGLFTRGVQIFKDAGYDFILTANLMNKTQEVLNEVGTFINPV